MLFIERVIGDTIMRAQMQNWLAITSFVTPFVVQLVFYVLRSIGLYVLARKQGLKSAWMCWIPLIWLYPAFRLVGDSVLGMPVKTVAIIFTAVFAVGEACTAVYNFISTVPYVGYFLQGGTITIRYSGLYSEIIPGSDFVNPFPSVYTWYMKTINYVGYVIGFLNLFITITLYINLFKKYWPQHYILAAVLSFFGLFGPFVFAIRKKDPIKYSDYLRTRYGGMYYGGPYDNPYYGRNPDPSQPKPPENPFEEFAGKGEKDPGDPFSEFGDDDKKDGKGGN